MQNLETIDWPKIIRHLASFATSSEARDLLHQTHPLESQTQAAENFIRIAEAQELLSRGERPFMESLDLYHSWYHRLEKQSQLKPLELKDIRLFFLETLSLKKILKSSEKDWGKKIAKILMDPEPPLSAIDHLITPQAEIRIDASETLYNLYNEKKSQTQKIQNTLNSIVKSHDNENYLQDKFVTNREGRWVIPVKSGMRYEVPGIIHATSTTKQTVFVEPQDVVPLNNQLKRIEAEIEEEIENLLNQISKYLHGLVSDIITTRQLLLDCDVLFAQAQFSGALNARAVRFSETEIDLLEVRHPLMIINSEKVIPNTVRLNEHERILLLSGPNAGGKTVLLKCFGIAAQMARCGLPICAAEGSHLPFFKDVVVAVGDSQSVDSQLSTFVGHLKTLNEACNVQGPSSLILIDEICGSTDPEEGSALARGFIQFYSQNKSFAVITSHLGPLKSGWKSDSAVINGSMEYNRSTGSSTYHFVKGLPGQSLAFSTAKRIGINPQVYELAQKHLSPESRHRLDAMDDVEKLKAQARELREELNLKIQETEAEKSNLIKKIKEFEKERENRLKVEVNKVKEMLLEESKKSNLQKIFTDHERRSNIVLEFPEVIKGPQTEEEYTLEKFTKAFPPGSPIYINSLQKDGVVQSTPNKQGEVQVLAGSMRLSVSWEDLKPPKRATNPLNKRNMNTPVHFEIADKGETIDVRGKNVSMAIEELESFLDAALGRRHERVKVVHGHGSEALKKAIRNHLSRSVYVNRWSSSLDSNGDDGTTWIYLALD